MILQNYLKKNAQLLNSNFINYRYKYSLYEGMSVCKIEYLVESYPHKQKVKCLDLRSTSSAKIHQIENLSPFINLKTLILSNNMISEMSGLSSLKNLKILNLEFNHIRVVQGTENLINLEELFLSYNEIECLGSCLRSNRKLRVLFLAYNEIENIEDLAILYSNESCGGDGGERELGCGKNEEKEWPSRIREEIKAEEDYQIQENDSISPIKQSPNKRSEDGSPNISPNKYQQQFYPSSSARFPNLTHLSLANNPVIQKLNYTKFLSMLIPTLTNIDEIILETEGNALSRASNLQEESSLINTNKNSRMFSSIKNAVSSQQFPVVQPNQEVLILREAIDGLLDERQQYLHRLQEQTEKMKNIQIVEKNEEKNISNASIDRYINKIVIQQRQWQQILTAMSQKYRKRLQTQRKLISQLSQAYTSIITTKRQKQQQPSFSQPPQNSKQLLQELKLTQQKSTINKIKLKRINYLLNKVKNANQNNDRIINRKQGAGRNTEGQIIDTTKMILEVMIFGKIFDEEGEGRYTSRKKSRVMNRYYREFKRSLIQLETLSINTIKNQQNTSSQIQQPNPFQKINLTTYRDTLLNLIFNQTVSEKQNPQNLMDISSKSALALKQKIGNKSLLEIISELHQNSEAERADQAEFIKNRKKFIKEFETETHKLCIEYENIEKAKEQFEEHKERMLKQLEQSINKGKMRYQRVEEEQKARIKNLKKTRESLQIQSQRRQNELQGLEQQLQSKILELEQFQKHFQDFVREKQSIQHLSEQLSRIQQEVKQEEEKFHRLTHHVQSLKIQENIQSNKIEKILNEIKEKKHEMYELQEQHERLLERNRQELHAKNTQLSELNIKLQQQYTKLVGNKEMQKNIERTAKNYALLEQKVNNLEKIHQSKKQEIRETERDLQTMSSQKNYLMEQLTKIQNSIMKQKEEQVRYEMKLRENRLAMESLADLNCSINQMMMRQSELKRANIELQIQNRNLLEMRNGIKEDLRMKSYL